MLRRFSLPVLLALVTVTVGCASLEGLRAFIQPPRFEQSAGRRSEIRLSGSGGGLPGGASVRLWTSVTNPNNFGFTLGTVRGTLHLEGARAATVDFPLGLPLQANETAEVPIDITIDFRDLPALGQTISRAHRSTADRVRARGHDWRQRRPLRRAGLRADDDSARRAALSAACGASDGHGYSRA